VTDKPDSFDPIDSIAKDHPQAIDDCNDLANALVVKTGDEKEPHWNQAAEMHIAASAAAVVAYGEKQFGTRSLQMVRETIGNPQRLEKTIQLMTESDCWGGALAQMGWQLRHFVEKEKSSVITTAGRQLAFLGSPAVMESTRGTSFDPSQLRNGKMTVYLVIPPERAPAQAGLLRLWIGSLMRACVREGLQ
jgi:type IV secretion system protein VirD4